MNTPTKPTFRAHGKDWFPHTPGDPMPCDGESKPTVLFADGGTSIGATLAKDWQWNDAHEGSNIVGWRYADPQPESAESVTDGLARLREEVANMRTAIQYAHEALTCVRCLEATDTDLKRAALAKLQPFT